MIWSGYVQRVCAICAWATLLASPALGEKVYWREGDTGSGTLIKRADLTGTDVQQLVSIPTALQNSFGLAVDAGAQRIYWAERENGRIRSANADGSNAVDVLTGLILPLNIELDLDNQDIYWTQEQDDLNPLSDPGLFRANLDGSNPIKLLAGEYWDLALDLTNQKIYLTSPSLWLSPGRVNLDGTGSEQLIPTATFQGLFGLEFASAISLDVGGGKMYFGTTGLPNPSTSIGRANLDGSNPEVLVQDLPSPPPGGFLVGNATGIVVDPGNGVMYWASVFGEGVFQANTDGSSVQSIYSAPSTAVTSVALDLTPKPVPTAGRGAVSLFVLVLLLGGSIAAVRMRRVGQVLPG